MIACNLRFVLKKEVLTVLSVLLIYYCAIASLPIHKRFSARFVMLQDFEGYKRVVEPGLKADE